MLQIAIELIFYNERAKEKLFCVELVRFAPEYTDIHGWKINWERMPRYFRIRFEFSLSILARKCELLM